jgi:hypothetical protein
MNPFKFPVSICYGDFSFSLNLMHTLALITSLIYYSSSLLAQAGFNNQPNLLLLWSTCLLCINIYSFKNQSFVSTQTDFLTSATFLPENFLASHRSAPVNVGAGMIMPCGEQHAPIRIIPAGGVLEKKSLISGRKSQQIIEQALTP